MQIFAICSSVPTEAIEVLKRKMYRLDESVYKSGERFDFFLGRGGWRPPGVAGRPNFKKLKSLIQNGGPNTHRKFQHSNSIRKGLKIKGTNSSFGVLKPHEGGRGTLIQKSKKATCRTVVTTRTENFSTPAKLELHSIIYLFLRNTYHEHPQFLVHIHLLWR